MARGTPKGTAQDLLGEAMRACRFAFIGVGLVSAIVNVLYLTGSFFMLEVYDRVLPSQSIPTLIGLSILVLMLFAFQGLFDFIRGRVLVRIGSALDDKLNGAVYDALVRLPLIAGPRAEVFAPLRNLDQVRSFMSGMGPAAFFDLPWIPFYLFICFAFHPILGWTATVGALLLVVLAILTEVLTKKHSGALQTLATQRHTLAESGRRNAEVLGAMGMGRRLQAAWRTKNNEFLTSSQHIADIVGALGALSKILRMVIQSGVLAVGAYLVIRQEATAGLIIAGSILAARALAPVELTIGNWKGFVQARQSWGKLKEAFSLVPQTPMLIDLPPPKETLSVEVGQRRASRRRSPRRPGRNFCPQARRRPRHHRPQRIRQILARADHCRRLDAGPRQGPARWRRARAVGTGRARRPYRLPAAERRAPRRNGRPEHFALHRQSAVHGGDCRRHRRGRPRHDPSAAPGL